MYMHNTLLVAALASVGLAANVCQHHANTKPNPTGNPIHKPEKAEQVPAGTDFEITWTPTETESKVSIALLRGPSDLAEEFQCLANSISNTGSFTWKVSQDLEADKTNYGLKIIVDNNGNYQYSDLFGIKNSKPKESKTSKAAQSTKASTTESTKSTDKPEKEHQNPTGHPNKKEHPKQQKEHKPAPVVVASLKPSKYQNSTIAHPTASSSSSKTHESSSKTFKTSKHPKSSNHPKSTHTEKGGEITSTDLQTQKPTAGSNPGQVTSMVVASAPGGEAGPAPTVTTAEGAPSSSPSPSPFPGAGPARPRVVSGLLMAVGAVVAWLVL